MNTASAPLVLYHCLDARSFRPLWALEELGLPYELRVLPFPPRYAARHYLEENPLGTIPLFVHGAVRMTESAGICQYLAALNDPGGLDVQPTEAAYGAYLNWLHMSDATLTFPQTLVLRYRYFETPERRQPQVAEDYAKWFLARLRAVDAALANDPQHLCAGRFTAADIAVSYALQLACQIGLDSEFPERVQRYWAGLQTRPGFVRAKQSQAAAAQAQGVKAPSPLQA